MSLHAKVNGAWQPVTDEERLFVKVAGAWSLIGTELPAYNDATGGTVTQFTADGKWFRVHTFTADGTFTVNAVSSKPFYAVLVGGGGGGGGTSVMQTPLGGGGGGGCLVYGPVGVDPNDPDGLAIPVGAHPITVGAGGGGGGYAGSSGGNSSIGTLAVALGGGGGAGEWRRNGLSGGSGGGCNNGESATGPGQGTPGQGTNGNDWWGGSALHQPVTIRGAAETFGVGTAVSGQASSQTMRGGAGIGVWMTGTGEGGQPGIVIISYEIEPPSYNDATGGTITTFVEAGKTYRLHTFTANGDFTILTSAQPFDVVGVGSGGGGRYRDPGGGGGGGRGERWQEQFAPGTYPIVVGAGTAADSGSGPANGNPSSAFGHTFAGGDAGPPGGAAGGGWSQTIDFEGTGPQGYGIGAGPYDYTVHGKYGGGGGGGATPGNWGFGSGGGVVQIRYEVASAE